MTSTRHSFRKAAESWLSESAGSVSEKTIEHYRWVLERFVFPNIEGSLEKREDYRALSVGAGEVCLS